MQAKAKKVKKAAKMINSKTRLAIVLSGLKGFEKPSVELEQYNTDSGIAAEVLWSAHMSGLVEGKVCADLGCGTGNLGIGLLLLGAEKVFFVDIDVKAIAVLKENIALAEESTGEELESRAQIMHADASMFRQKVDLVMQNPPFGTRNKHADLDFLRYAAKNSGFVYTFHKIETADFIEKTIAELGFRKFAFFSFDFPLRNTMPMHRKKAEHIKVGCWGIRKERII